MINNIEFENGYSEISINSWNKLVKLISDLDSSVSFAFRGEEESSFKLKSTFYRLYPDANQSILSFHLNNFKQEIRGRIQIPIEYQNSDDEMWAIGQHHGLKTPLLDWTYSAYVALYFAFYKKSTDDNAVLYILNLEALKLDLLIEIDKRTELLKENILKDIDYITKINNIQKGKVLRAQTILDIYNKEIQAPLETEHFCIDIVDTVLHKCIKQVVPKSGENNRIINQKGLFTFSKNSDAFDQVIQNKFKNSKLKVLLKIKISNKLKDSILRNLDTMNINHSVLFPDVGGAAVSCNNNISKIIKEEDKDYFQIDPSIHNQKRQFTLKTMQFLINFIYDDIKVNLNDVDFFSVYPIEDEWEHTVHSKLKGITNGEYIYGVYELIHNMLSSFPFEGLSMFQYLLLHSIIKESESLFLDSLDIPNKTTMNNFLLFFYAFTGMKSIRYKYDENNDEFIDIPITNIDEIQYEEWEKAWIDLEDDFLNIVDDQFYYYSHFTYLSEQPYVPTLSEYRKAYEWFKKVSYKKNDNNEYQDFYLS